MRTQSIWLVLLVATALAMPLTAQVPSTPSLATGHITGTVTDLNGDVVSGATVVLQGTGLQDTVKVLSDDNGFFDFKPLDAGTYRVTISALDFTDWNSPELVLSPSQYMILTGCNLRVAEVNTTVNVAYRPEEVATEQVQAEETQRVFGIIPNFLRRL